MKNKNKLPFDPTDIEQIWRLKAFVASPTFTVDPTVECREALVACLQELISRIKNQTDNQRDPFHPIDRPTGR